MSSQIIPVQPFDYVVFGGTGDLTKRKLLPALYHRFIAGQFSEPTRIIGAARSSLSNQEYREFAHQALKNYVGNETLDKDSVDKFLQIIFYVQVDAKSKTGWNELSTLLQNGEDKIRAFYLAVGPSLFGEFCKKIKQYDLVSDITRVVVEKPIGRDLKSATLLNETIGRVFREDQIFRIDHYLGKETVQNLMALRFANALFDPVWNSTYIDHIQITVAETVGLEDRIGYYNRAGALRDMVQNHMLQLLCLVAMEPPPSIEAESVRDEKLKVLRSLEPITAENVEKLTVRGQYSAGALAGGAVKGYIEELEDPVSDTETFVALKAEIGNWRWAGVPFYLRTGKRMRERVSEIVIQFKPIRHSIFSKAAGQIIANQLVIRLQPDEGVKQWVMIKDPGPGGMRLRHVPLDMSFAESFNVRNPDAYERLLLDVIRADQTLFMRRDEVEEAWKWIDPILKGWQETNQVLRQYTAGTSGPSHAIALIERDGRTWHENS